MKKNIFACMAFLALIGSELGAHRDSAYYHDSHDLSDGKNWMASLPDSTRLAKLSLPALMIRPPDLAAILFRLNP
jgi:hypothetical protein